jgi:transposase
MCADVVGMVAKERERAHAVRLVVEKKLKQREAAERLGVTARQIKRLVRAWREGGDAGLVSKQRGRVSPSQMKVEKREKIEGLLRDKYADFGPTLATEKLIELEGIVVSHETIRQLQIKLKLWKPKAAGHQRVFQPRERRPRFGEMIQIDGSPHDWFEGRAPRCTLIVFIDDATSRLTALRFTPTETTAAYLRALRQHILTYGVPLAFYSDKYGVFRVNAKEAATGDGKTEFNHVTERLKIEQICAHTPQAKGRVERSNQTLQDRLVKEMRLNGITGIEAANAFAATFIALWNKKFTVPARDEANAHRPWKESEEALDEIMARREERTLSKALTFSHNGTSYAVKTEGPGTAMRGGKITLYHFMNGTMRARYKGKWLTCTAYKTRGMPAAAEDDKSLNARMDAVVARTKADAGQGVFPPVSPPAPGRHLAGLHASTEI